LIRIRTIAPLTLALLAQGAAIPWPAAQILERRVLAMGTALRLELRGPDAAALSRGAEAALAEVGRIEAACSTWRPDSAWSRLNQASGASVPLDGEWLDLLASMKAWSLRTGGAFDPALRPLMDAWDIRGRGRRPWAKELHLARRASGAAHLHLDPDSGTARFDHPAAGLEEGGFLKGYALDRAVVKLKAAGAERGLLDFGGQLMAMGETTVSLADPVHRGQPRLALRLADASLSTSGTSERGRHLLDPRSGRPCAAWGSASVVHASALEADLLSTALYVMGPVQGLAWAEAHDLSACFLLNDGRTRMTRAFRALLISKESQ
jgi:thiamine biosynthesis lipoprotein